jgi:arylsulfatase
MEHHVRGRIGAAAALLLLAMIAPRAAPARPPNIVLVLADDLGYSDLGSYGGEIDTPTLDRLALAGVRFNRFYATPRCSPTRAALLTGLWSHQAGVGFLDRDWDRPAYRGAIAASVPTLAERLRARGYGNYMVGKWHLSPERIAPLAVETGSASPAPASWPLQRGFDAFYGTLVGSTSYFDPAQLYDGNVRAAWPPGGSTAGSSDAPYLTDVFGDRAASMVTSHLATTPERPFFLYLAFTAPHWPIHAPAADIERYRGRFDAGWDELRAARFERERELGIVPAGSVLPPRDPAIRAWNETPDREWQTRRMEVYAAMVTAMDRAVARVIAALEDTAALDDTVVVFLSDNGACAEDFRGLYALAPLVIEIPEQTADGRPMRFGDRPDVLPGSADTFATYGRGWAHLSNTPLRRYKHWTDEGGIAVPFFVHWPARLTGRAGSIVEAPAHVIDLVPTLEEIARDGDGAPVGESVEGPELRGESLLPLLRGEQPAQSRAFYWEHEGNRAISEGDWKLVLRWPIPGWGGGGWPIPGWGGGGWPFGWELYDLAADRFETNDLAAQDPDRVEQMAAHWSEWADEVGVETWPLVVPGVETALTTAASALFLLLVIVRAVRARRSGSPPRTPGPFPGGRKSVRERPSPSHPPAPAPPSSHHGPVKPIQPR